MDINSLIRPLAAFCKSGKCPYICVVTFVGRSLCAILLCVLCVGCTGKRNHPDLSDYLPGEGDIVFRRGGGAKSHAVLIADPDGIYSHTGIVVKEAGEYRVVHITPGERSKGEPEERIKIESLEEFFLSRKAKTGSVGRFADSTASVSAARHALRLLDKRILFDHDYDMEDSLKMYCTELIWYAYKLSGKDVTQGNISEIHNFGDLSGRYIMPSDIYNNDSLLIIYQF